MAESKLGAAGDGGGDGQSGLIGQSVAAAFYNERSVAFKGLGICESFGDVPLRATGAELEEMKGKLEARRMCEGKYRGRVPIELMSAELFSGYCKIILATVGKHGSILGALLPRGDDVITEQRAYVADGGGTDMRFATEKYVYTFEMVVA